MKVKLLLVDLLFGWFHLIFAQSFEPVASPLSPDIQNVIPCGVSASSVAFADIDGDNDMDVLITGDSYAGYISKLYLNDGVGNFIEKSDTPFNGVSIGRLSLLTDIDT